MPSRVLVVDDDPFLRRILSFLLAGAGHEVECVEDGEQAWDLLCRAAGDPPDLVISDLMMPGISGLDLVRRMRARPGLDIPVLILTARGQRIDEAEARLCGASAFMTKPFRSQELLDRISRLLAQSNAGDGEDEDCATGTDC